MSIVEVIRREAARWTLATGVVSLLVPLTLLLGALTTAAMLLGGGGWLRLPAMTPVLVWTVSLAAAGWLGLRFRRRLSRRATPAAVATAIERERGVRRGALTGLLEVEGSGVFAAHAAVAYGEALAPFATSPAPRHRWRLVRAAGLTVLTGVLIAGVASTSWARYPDGWQALFHPIEAWRGALVAPLRIVDPPSRVLRGSAVELEVDAPARGTVQLRWRATGGEWQQLVGRVAPNGRAQLRIPRADADLVILATDGRAGRDSIAVRVVDRPFVGDITITATYPAYLQRTPERFPGDAAMRIPAGTRLDVSGSASEPLERVQLLSGEDRVALMARGVRFAGALVPVATSVWAWRVDGAGAPIVDLPAPLDITVVPDSLPRVEIVAPVGEVAVDPAGRVTLELLAQDDHALTQVALRLRRLGTDERVTETRLSDRRDGYWSGTSVVDLAPFALAPGDGVEAVLVARDAAPGQRESVSIPVVLRVPTRDEAREAAREAADAAVSAAAAAAAAQAALAEETAVEARSRGDRADIADAPKASQPTSPSEATPTAGRDPQGRESLGYEGAERAREIAERQRALAKEVEELEEAARTLEDRLRSAGALDSGLARQLQDAQRMLREALTAQMREAMQQLEQATQQLDAPRTRQSMQQLAEQQRRLRETLERSAELLKRAALEGQLQTLADQGRDLADAQREMAERVRNGEQATAEAQRLQRESEQLARAADQLSERLEQAQAERGAQGTERGAEQAREAADALRQGGHDPSAATKAADAMERAAESLADARRDQVAAWKGELTDAMDRSVQELMQMAREQDALAQQARQSSDAAALRGAQSALQQGVQAAGDRLTEEARRSTLVSPRSQEMMQRAQQRAAQATREAAEGRRGQTEQAMREAADALRQAAAQLTRDRERAAQTRSATGMAELLEQLQQLAQQQGGLNSQMQSLLPMAQRQGGAGAQDQAVQQQARQLARAQREVAQQLDEVSDADPSGRAQELAREARALAAALDQGAIDPATQARQERLFRRMLDAGRSLEQDQRDENQRREARAARAYGRVVPTGPGRGPERDRFPVPTWEELRGLSAEDRRVVIEYFRQLNAQVVSP